MNKNKSDVITVDLHNMHVFEAANCLDDVIRNAPDNVKEIKVVHGYRNGTVLMDFIRKEYRNSRVKTKVITMNKGVTNLVLK